MIDIADWDAREDALRAEMEALCPDTLRQRHEEAEREAAELRRRQMENWARVPLRDDLPIPPRPPPAPVYPTGKERKRAPTAAGKTKKPKTPAKATTSSHPPAAVKRARGGSRISSPRNSPRMSKSGGTGTRAVELLR